MCQQQYEAEVLDELHQAEEIREAQQFDATTDTLFQMMVALMRRDVQQIQEQAK